MMKRFGISKRAFSLILCMVLGWAIALTVPQIHPAQAAVPFYWESINVDLDVQTNGDMLVTETQKYVFESDYSNQRYRYIRLDKVDGIQDVSVQENNQVLESTVTTEDNQLKIQWSHPLQAPEAHTFVLKYRVIGGLQVEGSSTQVFWRAVFVDRSAPVKTAKVTVHLPEALAGLVTSFQSFDAPANARQVDPRTFEFTAQQELPPQQTLEVQVAFPSAVLNLPQPQWQQQSTTIPFPIILPFLFFLSLSLWGFGMFKVISRTSTKHCPECNTRSLKRKKTQVLSRPTRSQSGERQEYWQCSNCQHHVESIVVIPWVVSSSSGGGGGCGGGGGGCGGGGGGGGCGGGG